MILSANFWRDAAERAIKTAAQTLLASFGIGVSVLSVNWQACLSITATATVLSVLSSIGSEDFGVFGTASLVGPPDAKPPTP